MQRNRQVPSIRYELPPLPQASPKYSSSTTSRLADISSILDASYGEASGWSELDPVNCPELSLPPPAMSAHPSSTSDRLGASPAATYGGSTDRSGRLAVTPELPSLHQVASSSQLRSPSATFSAQQIPFLAHFTPACTRSLQVHLALHYLYRLLRHATCPTPSAEAAKRAGITSTYESRGVSGSASPTTSYSSHSQSELTSPTAHYEPMTTDGMSYDPGSATALVERLVPLSRGQDNCQVMSIEIGSRTVQMPVDMQVASKVADEKRARNAGASVRFRRRRREKEVEASTTIGKLEDQVKELGEDADFCRRERDYLGNLLMQAPDYHRHFPRPSFPRRRRIRKAKPDPSGNTGRGFNSTWEIA
ncbi:hypothetical protein LTR49_025124 [Elasticomyces elasticus]|nr:hypothetical protein LTR49_025124 [Elasticomyces elasticus]